MDTLSERLGFDATDRIAIVHADDIGFCHAANDGAFEALDRGPATCGSVMVPCPWFAEAAVYAAARPNADLGVHLTLNCEYAHYRWGPLLGAQAVPSLVVHDGGFPQTVAEVAANARPDEAERELRAQIERALAAGIDVTHLDAHMGAAMLPSLISVYAKLAVDYRLPLFAVQPDAVALKLLGAETQQATLASALARLDAAGIPLLDGFDLASLHFEPGEGEVHNRARLAGLAPGVNYLVCHPARGGDELDALCDTAHMREFERSFYGGESGRRALDELGVRSVGMRAIRELVRGG